jgi:hypothetical protein
MRTERSRGVTPTRVVSTVLACAVAAMPILTRTAGAVSTPDDKRGRAAAIIVDIAAILNRWEPIAIAAGAEPSIWREQFDTQLGLLPETWRARLAAVEVDDTDLRGSYRRFVQVFVDALANAWHNADARAGIAPKLGSSTNDQVFVPIAPCRIVDTRFAGGAIPAGATRNFWFYAEDPNWIWSSQGGVGGAASTSCPGTVLTTNGPLLGTFPPSAAMATISVVNASAAGNWIVWGGGGTAPTASALNWTGAGQVLANTTVIPWGGRTGTNPGGAVLDFAVRYNGPTGFADVIVDVVGYFTENRATALQCVSLFADATQCAPNSTCLSFPPACAAGYTQTATYCNAGGDQLSLIDIRQDRCFARNTDTVSSLALIGVARCCRVPGQ